jgi:transposase
MLMLPPGSRVFLATECVDGRKGIDGLSAFVRSQFAEDPLSGTLFVFFSKRADRVGVLYWDRDGYVLTMKRLEEGRYRIPWRSQHGHVVVEAAELLSVLEGIDLTHAARRKRWTPRRSAAYKKNDTEPGAWNFSLGLSVVLGECPHVPAR